MQSARGATTSALIALLLLAPAPTLGVYFAMMHEPTRGTPVGQGIYALSKVWILILPLIWMKFVDRQRWSVSPAKQGGLLMGAVLGLAIGAIIIATYFIAGAKLIDARQMRDALVANGLDSPAKYIMLALYLTFINALLEEYVWRWFVFRKCEILAGGKIAVVVSALMFTTHHIFALASQTNWTVTLLANTGIFIGGCVWSWCYLRYRSIWPGYVSHLIVDAAVFLVGWWILFE